MVVGIGGIGNFRDPGDPNDPRRGTSVPQTNGAPGLPDPIELLIQAQREKLQAEPSIAESPRGRPVQQPIQSQSGETFGTNTETPTRFGAGGGAQITPPMSSNSGPRRILTQEDGTRIFVPASKGKRVTSSGMQTAIDNRRTSPVRPRYVQSTEATPTDLPNLPPEVTRPGEVTSSQLDADARALADEFSAMGIAVTEEDVAILREYVGGQRPTEAVEDTRVVLTADGEKKKGFGNLTDSEINPDYRGSRPVPNQMRPEIAPFTTIQVPVIDRNGNVEGTKTIDPQSTYRTEQGSREQIANAKHASEEENRISVANRASQIKKDNRTPLISTDQFNQLLASGELIQVAGQGRHSANLRMPDGTVVPVYDTNIRDNTEIAAPMYRVGAPTNVDFDAARDEANPRYKEESGPFDTQVVRTGAYVKRDADGNPIPDDRGKLARTEGRAVETGPVPFLNREDVYDKVAGIRKNNERAASTKGEKGRGVYTDHLSEGVQRRIAEGMSPRPTGGTREERIAHDTVSSFVQTGSSGKPYVRAADLASPRDGLEQAITELDEVMNAVASSGYMEDPAAVNGYQRMAVMIQRGELDPGAVPERARGEVARELQMLQATQATPTRVPIQSEAVITEAVPDRESDLVAAEVRGDERNFDGSGRVVQGSYGDFGESGPDEGGMRGFSVQTDPSILATQPELAARFAVADALGVKPDVRGEFSPSMTAQLDEMGQHVLRHAQNQITLGKGSDFGSQLAVSADHLFKRNVEQIAPKRPADVHDRGFKGFVQDIAVEEEATAVPQSTSQGVANTESVSQLNAPASPTGVEVDPRVQSLIDSGGNGIRQSQIDLMQKGLAAPEGSATRNAAESLLRRYGR